MTVRPTTLVAGLALAALALMPWQSDGAGPWASICQGAEQTVLESGSAQPLSGVTFPGATLSSTEGASVSLPSLKGKRGTALLFLSTECPISNGYVATLKRLAESEANREISFVVLNPNDGQKLSEMKAHRSEYAISLPVLKDIGGKVARAVGVSYCPEVCLFDAKGTLRYRGRIDDRYARRGGAAADVTSPDFERAIQQVVAGNAGPTLVTKPIGCPIHFADEWAATVTKPGTVTYSKEIARIMRKQCEECHRPEGVAPFALVRYDQVRSWAEDIQTVTAEGTMPPWKPVAGFGDFHNTRVLQPVEHEQIAAWIQAGCPEGDRADLPEPVAYNDSWTLGQPDLIVDTGVDFQLEADGRDVYRCFVIPTNLSDDMYVSAHEVLPGNRRIVHHVIAFLDLTDASTKLDAKDPGPGYATSAGSPGFLPSGGVGGWAPGNFPHRLPDGMAKPLPKGAKIVLQVHYHKTGKPETDRTRLGLYFSKKPVTRAVRTIMIMPPRGPLGGLRIPPGEPNHQVDASITLSRDVYAIGVTPHMHLIGKDMKLTATLPDGTVQPMIFVDNWDFKWQGHYQYRKPVALPAETQLDLVAHFDNSAENPANPSKPPQLVKWGEQTEDEMCIAFLEVVSQAEAKSKADLQPPPPGWMLKEYFARRLKASLKGAARSSDQPSKKSNDKPSKAPEPASTRSSK